MNTTGSPFALVVLFPTPGFMELIFDQRGRLHIDYHVNPGSEMTIIAGIKPANPDRQPLSCRYLLASTISPTKAGTVQLASDLPLNVATKNNP